MPKVESSAIRRVEYNQQTFQLYVTFVSGKHYVYADVPAELYAAFLDAPFQRRILQRTDSGRIRFRPPAGFGPTSALGV